MNDYFSTPLQAEISRPKSETLAPLDFGSVIGRNSIAHQLLCSLHTSVPQLLLLYSRMMIAQGLRRFSA